MSFWDNVEILRKEQKTSYRWIASVMGVSETTVSSMRKNDTEPRTTESFKIAQSLHTTVEFLVTGKQSPDPQYISLKNDMQKLLDTH